MKRIHYSWIICAGCTLLLFCTGGLLVNAFSVYQPYMIANGGFSNTQGSEIVTIRSLAALISFFFVEKFYRRLDIRLGVTLATCGAAAGFILFGLSKSFISYAIAATVTGIAYGLGAMIPVSIMIERWFHSHKALALGICAAGTGLAGIVAPPLVTAIIESTSLASAFYVWAGFMGGMAILIFLLLRNRPEEKGTTPLESRAIEKGPVQANTHVQAGPGTTMTMTAAVVLIGMIAQPGYSHLSVLFKTVGFQSMTVALLISVVGTTLTAGKVIYGRVTDRLGAYRSGYLFFGTMIIGVTLACFVGHANLAIALAAMFFLGLGLPLGTVGISVFAADVAATSGYAKMVKRFQMAYLTGSLIFGPVPGMIADATGSYIPFYVLLILFAAISMLLVQFSYRRIHASNQTPHPNVAIVLSELNPVATKGS